MGSYITTDTFILPRGLQAWTEGYTNLTVAAILCSQQLYEIIQMNGKRSYILYHKIPGTDSQPININLNI